MKPGVQKKTRAVRAPNPKLLLRAQEVAEVLAKAYPQAHCALIHDGPLQLLVATILSAQCTDARVNLVTPDLFKKYPTAQSFALAEPLELEQAIQSTGFFRNKARSIREACRDIVACHGGQVPRTMEALTKLRGVGRKTANVVLGNAFGVPGMVVDTHVGRISARLGFTPHQDPIKVEQDLMRLFPPQQWVALGHRFIQHGRTYCKAPKPKCAGCPIEKLCHYPKNNF